MMRRWPLLLLALPAFVATWSGWVGLGELTGFGTVKPLPGIADDFTINSAVTLPIGLETYAAYALGAWLSGRQLAPGTRAFAKWSSIGALLLGMLGQVAYHLLVTFDLKATPWQIVTAVSCLPVLVLGMGAGLGHMLARDAHAVPAGGEFSPPAAAEAAPPPECVPETPRVPVSQEVYDWSAERDLFDSATLDDAPEPPQVDDPAPDLDEEPEPDEYVPGGLPEELLKTAANRFFFHVTGGKVPGVRQLKTELSIGQSKAQQVRAYLATLAAQ